MNIYGKHENLMSFQMQLKSGICKIFLLHSYMMVIGNIHGDVEKKSKEIMYLHIIFDVRSF